MEHGWSVKLNNLERLKLDTAQDDNRRKAYIAVERDGDAKPTNIYAYATGGATEEEAAAAASQISLGGDIGKQEFSAVIDQGGAIRDKYKNEYLSIGNSGYNSKTFGKGIVPERITNDDGSITIKATQEFLDSAGYQNFKNKYADELQGQKFSEVNGAKFDEFWNANYGSAMGQSINNKISREAYEKSFDKSVDIEKVKNSWNQMKELNQLSNMSYAEAEKYFKKYAEEKGFKYKKMEEMTASEALNNKDFDIKILGKNGEEKTFNLYRVWASGDEAVKMYKKAGIHPFKEDFWTDPWQGYDSNKAAEDGLVLFSHLGQSAYNAMANYQSTDRSVDDEGNITYSPSEGAFNQEVEYGAWTKTMLGVKSLTLAFEDAFAFGAVGQIHRSLMGLDGDADIRDAKGAWGTNEYSVSEAFGYSQSRNGDWFFNELVNGGTMVAGSLAGHIATSMVIGAGAKAIGGALSTGGVNLLKDSMAVAGTAEKTISTTGSLLSNAAFKGYMVLGTNGLSVANGVLSNTLSGMGLGLVSGFTASTVRGLSRKGGDLSDVFSDTLKMTMAGAATGFTKYLGDKVAEKGVNAYNKMKGTIKNDHFNIGKMEKLANSKAFNTKEAKAALRDAGFVGKEAVKNVKNPALSEYAKHLDEVGQSAQSQFVEAVKKGKVSNETVQRILDRVGIPEKEAAKVFVKGTGGVKNVKAVKAMEQYNKLRIEKAQEAIKKASSQIADAKTHREAHKITVQAVKQGFSEAKAAAPHLGTRLTAQAVKLPTNVLDKTAQAAINLVGDMIEESGYALSESTMKITSIEGTTDRKIDIFSEEARQYRTRSLTPMEYIEDTFEVFIGFDLSKLTVSKFMSMSNLFNAYGKTVRAAFKDADTSATRALARMHAGYDAWKLDNWVQWKEKIPEKVDGSLWQKTKHYAAKKFTDTFVNEKKIIAHAEANKKFGFMTEGYSRASYLMDRNAAHNLQAAAASKYMHTLARAGGAKAFEEVRDTGIKQLEEMGFLANKKALETIFEDGKPKTSVMTAEGAALSRALSENDTLKGALNNAIKNGDDAKVKQFEERMAKNDAIIEDQPDFKVEKMREFNKLAQTMYTANQDVKLALGLDGSEFIEQARGSGNFDDYLPMVYVKTDTGEVVNQNVINSVEHKHKTWGEAPEGLTALDPLTSTLYRMYETQSAIGRQQLKDISDSLTLMNNGVFEYQPKVAEDVKIPDSGELRNFMRNDVAFRKEMADYVEERAGKVAGVEQAEVVSGITQSLIDKYATRIADEYKIPLTEAYDKVLNSSDFSKDITNDVLQGFAKADDSMGVIASVEAKIDSILNDNLSDAGKHANELKQEFLEAYEEVAKYGDSVPDRLVEQLNSAQNKYEHAIGESILRGEFTPSLITDDISEKFGAIAEAYKKQTELLADMKAVENMVDNLVKIDKMEAEVAKDFLESIRKRKDLWENREAISAEIKQFFTDYDGKLPEDIGRIFTKDGKIRNNKVIRGTIEMYLDKTISDSIKAKAEARLQKIEELSGKYEELSKLASDEIRDNSVLKSIEDIKKDTEGFKPFIDKYKELNAKEIEFRKALAIARNEGDLIEVDRILGLAGKNSEEISKLKKEVSSLYQESIKKAVDIKSGVRSAIYTEDTYDQIYKTVEQSVELKKAYVAELEPADLEANVMKAKLLGDVATPDSSNIKKFAIGDKTFMVDSEPYLALLSRHTPPKELGKFMKFASLVSQGFRNGTTNWNFNSWLRNLPKDALNSLVNGRSAGTFEAIASAMRKDGFNPFDIESFESRKLLGEYLYEGLKNSGDVQLDKASFLRATEALFATVKQDGTLINSSKSMFDDLKSENLAQKGLNTYLKLGEMGEQGSRVMNAIDGFKTSLLDGDSLDDAVKMGIFDSKNTTTNFEFRFNNISHLSKGTSYLNSKMASAASTRLMFLANPVSTAFNWMSYVAAPFYALHLHHSEHQDQLKDIPDYVLDTNFVIFRNGRAVLYPMHEEFQSIWTAMRRIFTAPEDRNYYSAMANLLHPHTGINISHFFEKNDADSIAEHLYKSAVKTAAEFTPDVGRLGFELATGMDTFTGGEIYRKAPPALMKLINPEYDEYDKENQGLALAIGMGANALFGRMSSYVFNVLEGWAGVAKEGRKSMSATGHTERTFNPSIGLKSIKENKARVGYKQQANQFQAEIKEFEAEKDRIYKKVQKLTTESNKLKGEEREAKLAEIRELQEQFGESVMNWFENWDEAVQSGNIEMDDKKMNQIINIIKFGDEGVKTGDEFIDKENSETFYAARSKALQRYLDSGMSKYLDDNKRIDTMTQISRGLPARARYDASQLRNLEVEGRKLSQVRKEYNDEIYALIKAKKYKEANALGKEYAEKYFEPAVHSLVEIYGAKVVENQDVLNEIKKVFITPGEYAVDKRGRAISTKNQLDRDAGYIKSYVKGLYRDDEGNIKEQHLKSDASVLNAKKEVERRFNSGDISGAKELAKRAMNNITMNKLYSTQADINFFKKYQ